VSCGEETYRLTEQVADRQATDVVAALVGHANDATEETPIDGQYFAGTGRSPFIGEPNCRCVSPRSDDRRMNHSPVVLR